MPMPARDQKVPKDRTVEGAVLVPMLPKGQMAPMDLMVRVAVALVPKGLRLLPARVPVHPAA